MIFPTCSRVSSDGIGEDCYINIAFNQQLSLCSSTTESGTKRTCRSPQDLCIADPNFRFEFNDSSKKSVCSLSYTVDVDNKRIFLLVIHTIPNQVFVLGTKIPPGLRYFVTATCSPATEVGRRESRWLSRHIDDNSERERAHSRSLILYAMLTGCRRMLVSWLGKAWMDCCNE